MALNSDFRVRDSLYVGNSAYFVTQTDTPKILSAGIELFDIFMQGGAVVAQCSLTNGTAIATLDYDGSSNTTIGINATCNTTWNSAYTTTQSNSASWVNAATWCTTNGDNVIDTVAEGNAQGRVAVTDIGNTTTQVDVNGLQTNDSPQFNGMCLTGPFTTSSTIDGRDVAVDGTTLDTLQSLSGGNVTDVSASATQGRLVETSGDGTTDNIDLTNLGTAGTPTFNCITLCGLGNVVDNTVMTINASGTVGTDEVDSKIFGTDLVDGGGTSGTVPVYSNGTGTIGDSNIRIDGGAYVYIEGGLSATGALSGDGSGLTGITATPTFPTVGATTMASTDKIFINDGATCQTACNKHITVSNFVTDFAGTGLAAEGSEQFSLKNAASLTDQAVLMWDDSNGQLTDSIISVTALGNVTIAGGATITGNLSVQGDLTCINTLLQTTSAICTVNAGTGPALYVEQTGASQPIAKFVDTEGGQVVIGDTGSIGIGILGDTPGEKLTVSGNISANGDLRIDGITTLYGIISTNIGAATDNTVVINTPSGLATDEIDSKVWGGAVVDYATSTTNAVPKFTDGTGTIGDSNITDSGTVVTINSDTVIDSTHSFTVKAAASTYSETAAFTDLISTTGTVVTTFPKSNLKSATYHITLVNGVNVTAFDVNAVYNGTDPRGTVYGIVDAQAASQLNDIAITDAGSTIELSISSTAASTTAIIEGTALYTS